MGKKIYIYEWLAWDAFLFPLAFKNATRIPAKIKENHNDILKNIQDVNSYFLFHINLTFPSILSQNRPLLIKKIIKMGLIPLNCVTDISKSNVQKNCISLNLNHTLALENGDLHEILIVKPNLNHGGKLERALDQDHKEVLKIKTTAFYKWDYKIVERKDIPPFIWSSKDYVIEKFISNKNNKFIRAYKVLNKIVLSEVIDENQIKKMPDDIKRENHYYDSSKKSQIQNKSHLKLIQDIETLCHGMLVDLAAIDIVIDDDENYYIIDVNKTPWWGGDSSQQTLFDFLEQGLV